MREEGGVLVRAERWDERVERIVAVKREDGEKGGGVGNERSYEYITWESMIEKRVSVLGIKEVRFGGSNCGMGPWGAWQSPISPGGARDPDSRGRDTLPRLERANNKIAT